MANKPRVLVVEDDVMVCEMIAAALRTAGHDVVTANEGRDGFRSASLGDYDLLVVDINLPGWSGTDLLKSLDVLENDAKIIIVTGMSLSDLGDDVVQQPRVAAVFEKPFDIEALVDAARRATQ